MKRSLNILGSFFGIFGLIVCAVSGIARIIGSYHMGGYEAMTLFVAGMGLLVLACFLKLESLASGS